MLPYVPRSVRVAPGGVKTPHCVSLSSPNSGSGKTTVATIAMVQSLFTDTAEINGETISVNSSGNLVLYLVPSKALAAEVESRLAQDFRGISVEPVEITGLYGGID